MGFGELLGLVVFAGVFFFGGMLFERRKAAKEAAKLKK